MEYYIDFITLPIVDADSPKEAIEKAIEMAKNGELCLQAYKLKGLESWDE
jgi:hypothetical protein